MNKTEAIKSLKEKILEIKILHTVTRFSAKHTKWVSDTLYLLEDIFGTNSRIFITFASLTWQAKGSYITRGYDPQDEIRQWHHIGYISDLETAKGLLESGIEQIKRKGIENIYSGKTPPSQSSDIVKIISLIDTKLRKFMRNKPDKEKEIQDALENLFIAADLEKEFTREKETITYSSKAYIPDFIFKKISTIVETKLCTTPMKEKAIISEINDDILAYKTAYSNIIFVVYDLGIIRDQDQFRDSLEANENVIIKVIKH